jgi:putative tricarboxylic transport membrane protein
MSISIWQRCMRPTTLTALGTLVLVIVFVPSTLILPSISALLPGVMLAALVVLALLLLIRDQRDAATQTSTDVKHHSTFRVLIAFALIVGYALAVEWLGFYPSTAVGVPLTAFVFGYRQKLGLLIATLVVTGGIYLIFSLAMAQEFPSGLLWSR